MDIMTEFINEFVVRKQETELSQYSVKCSISLEKQVNFDKKIAAEVAAKLTTEMQTPIAAVGNHLVCDVDVKLADVVTITTKLEGKPTDVEVEIKKMSNIKKSQVGFNDAV
jgi:hypothetical protein